MFWIMLARTLLVAVILVAGCAPQPARVSTSPWPQTVVNAPKQQVREELIATLTSTGAAVDDVNDSLIQLRIPDSNTAATKAIFGCEFCADPYIKANIVLARVGNGTQVVAQYWRVVPKSNGSAERMDIDNSADYNSWQEALWKLRDRHR